MDFFKLNTDNNHAKLFLITKRKISSQNKKNLTQTYWTDSEKQTVFSLLEICFDRPFMQIYKQGPFLS